MLDCNFLKLCLIMLIIYRLGFLKSVHRFNSERGYQVNDIKILVKAWHVNKKDTFLVTELLCSCFHILETQAQRQFKEGLFKVMSCIRHYAVSMYCFATLLD